MQDPDFPAGGLYCERTWSGHAAGRCLVSAPAETRATAVCRRGRHSAWLSVTQSHHGLSGRPLTFPASPHPAAPRRALAGMMPTCAFPEQGRMRLEGGSRLAALRRDGLALGYPPALGSHTRRAQYRCRARGLTTATRAVRSQRDLTREVCRAEGTRRFPIRRPLTGSRAASARHPRHAAGLMNVRSPRPTVQRAAP